MDKAVRDHPHSRTHRIERWRITIHGLVQGVGFRPSVFRLARELNLKGWIQNSPSGVVLDVESSPEGLTEFTRRLKSEVPRHARIDNLESVRLDPKGYSDFRIIESDASGPRIAPVLPDIATCAECLYEVFNPKDRRHLYPFTNCTHCGPRYSIIESLPYDRGNTSMKGFGMCDACQAEYEDPDNRRFHAQPNACPTCGPQVQLWDNTGNVLADRNRAILAVASTLREGFVVAVKGLGGFLLLVDARSGDAVQRLRKRKGREEKPFALMYADLGMVSDDCIVSAEERRLMASSVAPIVLLRRKPSSAIDDSVAPHNPALGVMLPYTPLHHILMRGLGFPVVATSGNLTDEPICTDENEALERLQGIADFFLVHDRPIVRQVDDSIVRLIAEREMILRRARGFAPAPIHVSTPLVPTLAVGAHLKNAIAIARDNEVVVSQHIGDLETVHAYDAFEKTVEDLTTLHGSAIERVACDAHPDYRSTRYAHQRASNVACVQHHYAHVVSCMAENDLTGPVLGVCWDGTGYGLDGTIWGGEFLEATLDGFSRVAHLGMFPLPGGEAAVREPRRAAIGLLYALVGSSLSDLSNIPALQRFSKTQISALIRMMERGTNCLQTSSIGRLFDAVSSLLGLCHVSSFEGQAAMEVEFLAESANSDDMYKLPIDLKRSPDGSLILDWSSMVHAMLDDLKTEELHGEIAARFHNTLIDGIVMIATIRDVEAVVLSGGCFQNRILIEGAIRRLRGKGFRPYWHQRVPPNDGGVALGQAVHAGSERGGEKTCV